MREIPVRGEKPVKRSARGLRRGGKREKKTDGKGKEGVRQGGGKGGLVKSGSEGSLTSDNGGGNVKTSMEEGMSRLQYCCIVKLIVYSKLKTIKLQTIREWGTKRKEQTKRANMIWSMTLAALQTTLTDDGDCTWGKFVKDMQPPCFDIRTTSATR